MPEKQSLPPEFAQFQKQWEGLRKVLTPEGHYLWLCEHHAKEYLI